MTPRPTRSTLFPYTTLFRSQGDLQRGFVLRVANQQIGQAVGTCVHGAANRNAQILMPMAAKILEAGEQAGLDNGDSHAVSCRSAWKAWASISTNFTVSPGCNSVGGSWVGSNSTTGVAPIMFQPPGLALG